MVTSAHRQHLVPRALVSRKNSVCFGGKLGATVAFSSDQQLCSENVKLDCLCFECNEFDKMCISNYLVVFRG